jgi:hypothetical protein
MILVRVPIRSSRWKFVERDLQKFFQSWISRGELSVGLQGSSSLTGVFSLARLPFF